MWKPDGEGNETFEEEDDGDLEAGDGEEVVNPYGHASIVFCR